MGVAFSGNATIVSRFTRSPADLGTSSFSGPAVRPLPRLESAMMLGTSHDALN
jgi:hypothetical protein